MLAARQSDTQSVEFRADLDLATQSAVRGHVIGNAEHAQFVLAGLRSEVSIHIDMTRGARAVTTAVAIDARYAVTNRDGHEGVAR